MLRQRNDRPVGTEQLMGRGINASLLGVQFAKDGEPFGDGRCASADDFDVVDADDDMSF